MPNHQNLCVGIKNQLAQNGKSNRILSATGRQAGAGVTVLCTPDVRIFNIYIHVNSFCRVEPSISILHPSDFNGDGVLDLLAVHQVSASTLGYGAAPPDAFRAEVHWGAVSGDGNVSLGKSAFAHAYVCTYVRTVVYGYMHDTCYMYVHSLNAFSMFFIRMYVRTCMWVFRIHLYVYVCRC